jgi:hypothetical protein
MGKLTAAKFLARWIALGVVYGLLVLVLYLLDRAFTERFSTFDATVAEGVVWSFWYGAGILVFAMADVLVRAFQARPSDDFRYYPVLRGPRVLVRKAGSRLILISGAFVLAGYWTYMGIQIWAEGQSPHGNMLLPPMIFHSCLLTWGIGWTADCARRPRGGTIVAAALFTAWTVFLTVVDTGIVLE